MQNAEDLDSVAAKRRGRRRDDGVGGRAPARRRTRSPPAESSWKGQVIAGECSDELITDSK